MNDDFDKNWKSRWEEFWLPLLINDLGELDKRLIKNEIHDLHFIYEQIDKVYTALTGGKLSKLMYYADTIIKLHEQEVQDAYDEGYNEAKKELGE
jgi:hypothetical protein